MATLINTHEFKQHKYLAEKKFIRDYEVKILWGAISYWKGHWHETWITTDKCSLCFEQENTAIHGHHKIDGFDGKGKE